MDCSPTRAAVLDYGARCAIEPTFSDFKSRGFHLENSQLEHADRLDRLILIMALAMRWSGRCLTTSDTPGKKPTRRPISSTGALKNSAAA
jgi:hypothetical protein